jgi:hypothetical protein
MRSSRVIFSSNRIFGGKPQFAKTNSRTFDGDVYDVTLGSSAIFGKGTFGKRFGTKSQDQLEH